MIDVRKDSIIYQSQVYYTDLINELVEKRKVGKANEKSWEKADTISGYLDALNYIDVLEDDDDITNVNYILECLIILCELNQYPVSAPIEFQAPPAVLVGVQGEPGTSVTGPQGPAGLATDFQVSLVTTPTVVDSFDLVDAKGARWDYVILSDDGYQRAGSVIGTWLDDGSDLAWFDTSTGDIAGDTDPLSFSVEFLIDEIRLVATPASGTWTVIGTRYFIPNNGNGSGPIGDVLANGKVYIGNASNVATAQTISGDITITNVGVATIANSAVTNVKVDAAAGIELTKLEALVGGYVTVTDISGFISESIVTTAELESLSGIAGNVQDELDLKITDPTTTVGDIIIRDAGNNLTRLGIGTAGQVLTVAGGAPSWAAVPGGITGLTTHYLPKATSATTIGNSLLVETGSAISTTGTLEAQSGMRTASTGPYLRTKVIDIDEWDMDSILYNPHSVSHGLDYTKIRSISVIVRADSNVPNVPHYDLTYADTSGVAQGRFTYGSTSVFLYRTTGGTFDSTDFNDNTSYNRGWITIVYEA
jgi:hypothetical protein